MAGFCGLVNNNVCYHGTLNNSKDKDKGWSVEFAIPFSALSLGSGKNIPKEGTLWRINFSRVEWNTMNNEQIPDIYNTGRDYYTYWFVKNFKEEQPENGNQVWLKFRGINYSCRIYLNGKLVNKEPYEGM